MPLQVRSQKKKYDWGKKLLLRICPLLNSLPKYLGCLWWLYLNKNKQNDWGKCLGLPVTGNGPALYADLQFSSLLQAYMTLHALNCKRCIYILYRVNYLHSVILDRMLIVASFYIVPPSPDYGWVWNEYGCWSVNLNEESFNSSSFGQWDTSSEEPYQMMGKCSLIVLSLNASGTLFTSTRTHTHLVRPWYQLKLLIYLFDQTAVS